MPRKKALAENPALAQKVVDAILAKRAAAPADLSGFLWDQARQI